MNNLKDGPEKEKARSVVRMLGGNSIPLLLEWTRQEDRPSFIQRFNDWKAKIIHWLEAHHVIKPVTISYFLDFNPSHSAMATWALAELDPAAKTAVIPTLIQMLGDKSPDTNELSRAAGGAFLAVRNMTPESITPLIAALDSQNRQVWSLAATALGDIGPQAKAAIPILAKRLDDKDPIIRVSAAEIIGKLGGDPGTFIPVVIQTLPELDRENMDYALDILVRYKEHAKAALPVFVDLLKSAADSTNIIDVIMRDRLTNAIRQIDSGTAVK
jgi:hypothetical protein